MDCASVACQEALPALDFQGLDRPGSCDKLTGERFFGDVHQRSVFDVHTGLYSFGDTMSERTTRSEREPSKGREERRPLPYEAPRLSHLGSMREITLAGSGTVTDGTAQGKMS